MTNWGQLAEYHKALGDQTRLHILALLKHEELCVCELVEVLKMSQPAVSQHMRKLKNVQLVKERRKGQWVFYSLDGSTCPFFQEVMDALPNTQDEIDELEASGLRVTC